MTLGIIDLGTNSARFDIYQIENNSISQRLYRTKDMIRLGEGVFHDGKLHSTAVERALTCFSDISKKLKEYSVDHVLAFGTSALRDAKNAEDFVKQVDKKFNISIEIISGQREADLIAKAILNNEILPGEVSALVDIGGGSTEFTVCYKNTSIASHSFNLGAARLQQMFLDKAETLSARVNAVNELRLHVRKELSMFNQKRNWLPIFSATGSSGTIRALTRLIKKQDRETEPFSRKDLNRLVEKLIPLNRKELEDFPGMEPKRIDIILAGSLLFEQILEEFYIEEVYTTELSLRDGILDDYMEKYLTQSSKKTSATAKN